MFGTWRWSVLLKDVVAWSTPPAYWTLPLQRWKSHQPKQINREYFNITKKTVLQWSLVYPACMYPEIPLSRRFLLGMKKSNVILLHFYPCFWNRTVVRVTNPCFTMTIGPCYPDRRLSVINLKAYWQYKHYVAYPCLIGDSISARGRVSSTFTANWTLNPLPHMAAFSRILPLPHRDAFSSVWELNPNITLNPRRIAHILTFMN